MPSITVPLADAKHLAAALLPHISTDLVTPVLTGFQVAGKYAVATDRYTVARYDLTNVLVGADEVPEPIWFPRAALAWVKTIGQASLLYDFATGRYHVRFSSVKHERYESSDYVQVEVIWMGGEDEPNFEEVHLLRRFTTRGARGNFPSVDRLFEQFLPGETAVIGLGAEQVEKFTAYAKFANRPAPIKITFPRANATGNKLMPSLVEIGQRFKGLIQPNIILDNAGYGVDLAAENVARDAEAAGKRADTKPADTEGGE